ncbi:hypothetical protein ACNKHP_23290 [Shigella boydii]
MCTLIIFFPALVRGVVWGASCLYLVRRVINRGIVGEKSHH